MLQTQRWGLKVVQDKLVFDLPHSHFLQPGIPTLPVTLQSLQGEALSRNFSYQAGLTHSKGFVFLQGFAPLAVLFAWGGNRFHQTLGLC